MAKSRDLVFKNETCCHQNEFLLIFLKNWDEKYVKYTIKLNVFVFSVFQTNWLVEIFQCNGISNWTAERFVRILLPLFFSQGLCLREGTRESVCSCLLFQLVWYLNAFTRKKSREKNVLIQWKRSTEKKNFREVTRLTPQNVNLCES